MSNIIKKIPLRERKAAQTKIDLVMCMLKKTATRKLNDISVKEICDDVLISEGTFFNHFKKKTDLLIYFIKLWSVESLYLCNKNVGFGSGLKRIEYIFAITSRYETIGNERIMYEIISYNAIDDDEMKISYDDLGKVEKMLAFPQYPDIEEIEINQFSEIFSSNLQLAISLGELPPTIDFANAMVYLGSIFYGVPVILKCNPELISNFYQTALETFWNVLRKS